MKRTISLFLCLILLLTLIPLTAFADPPESVQSGSEKMYNYIKNVVLVYADEYVPDEYGALQPAQNKPFAFACVLGEGAGTEGTAVEIDGVETVLDFVSRVKGKKNE